jgi:hypothetical protein
MIFCVFGFWVYCDFTLFQHAYPAGDFFYLTRSWKILIVETCCCGHFFSFNTMLIAGMSLFDGINRKEKNMRGCL